MRHLVLATCLAVFIAGCSAPPVNRDTTIPLTTVEKVDLGRYAGLWYEVARFPNEFETDCVGVTAHYATNPDGTIAVLNRCRKKTLDGPEDVAEGTARVVEPSSNAKLAVTFFWPFEGDYWILALADDYSWSLVGEPSGRYLWILSRSPRLDPDIRDALITKLKSLGYNTEALYWTPQG